MSDALKIGVFPLKSDDRMIGGILVDSGKLTIDDADRILRLQKGENMRFGEAGIKLGLLNSCDLQFALSRQFDYPYLRKGESSIGDELIAAYQPFSPRVEPLRALRSQLMLRCFTGSDNRRSLAIVSPERGEGRSYIAANLAVVFSQLGERTLLIDADMRNPRQCKLFNLGNNMGLSSILSERIRGDAVQRVPDLLDLSVLVAGASPPNPQELIGRPAFTKMLEEFEADYDVVLIDTPPCSEYADAQNIAARTGATVMVARKHKTRVELVREHTMLMMQSGAQVVGTLLNEF